MADFLGKAREYFNYLRFGDGDGYDDIDGEYIYEDDLYEKKREERLRQKEEEQERKRQEKLERKERKAAASYAASEEEDYPPFQTSSAPKKERFNRSAANNDKIVPLSQGRNFEVSVLRPNSITDAQSACDMLISGHAVIINLEGNEMERAQGIMDFISGCIYAISGNMHQISKYIFIFAPSTIDISGDYLDIAAEEGLIAPTIDEEY